MQPELRAGKHGTGAKGGKTCNPVPSAGKHATGAKGGKTCNWREGSDKIQPVLNGRKHHGTRSEVQQLCNVKANP